MDIKAGIQAAIFLSVIGAGFSIWVGLNQIRTARGLTFYRLRQKQMSRGWRLLWTGLVLTIFVFLIGKFGEPVVYRYFPPTPTIAPTATITLTPTITLVPTITLTPTITETPSVTDTPTPTSTPFIPPVIEALFESDVAPNTDAVFSPLQFSTVMENYQAVSPATYFLNPVDELFAVYSYNNMLPGVQVTDLWYRDGELVHYATAPWDGSTGGLGNAYCSYTLCDRWQPGEYQLRIFVGLEIRTSGIFVVDGEPLTATPTLTPSPTLEPTETPSP